MKNEIPVLVWEIILRNSVVLGFLGCVSLLYIAKHAYVELLRCELVGLHQREVLQQNVRKHGMSREVPRCVPIGYWLISPTGQNISRSRLNHLFQVAGIRQVARATRIWSHGSSQRKHSGVAAIGNHQHMPSRNGSYCSGDLRGDNPTCVAILSRVNGGQVSYVHLLVKVAVAGIVDHEAVRFAQVAPVSLQGRDNLVAGRVKEYLRLESILIFEYSRQ